MVRDETLRADIILRRDAYQPLARSGDGWDPLGRVPPTRLLVVANLADADGRRAEARLLRYTPEELLSDPLALGIPGAVCDFGGDLDCLDSRCGSRVVWRSCDEDAFQSRRQSGDIFRIETRAPETSGSKDESITLKSTL